MVLAQFGGLTLLTDMNRRIHEIIHAAWDLKIPLFFPVLLTKTLVLSSPQR
jgi:hypothetical protein